MWVRAHPAPLRRFNNLLHLWLKIITFMVGQLLHLWLKMITFTVGIITFMVKY